MCVRDGVRYTAAAVGEAGGPIAGLEAWKVLVRKELKLLDPRESSVLLVTPWERTTVVVGKVLESVSEDPYGKKAFVGDGWPLHGFHAYLARGAAEAILEGYYRSAWDGERLVLARVTLFEVFEIGKDWTAEGFREKVAVAKRMRVEEVIEESEEEKTR